MDDSLTKYHVWLFINGTQVGDKHTFADWYADDAAAGADARAFFASEGYDVESIEASEREIRPASSLAPALIGKVMIVRLKNGAENGATTQVP